MTVRRELEPEIARLGPQCPSGPQDISVAAPQGRVNVKLREAGPIGVSVDSLEVESSKLDADSARRACGKIAQRVNYLLEPLETVESDAESGVTRMRSQHPTVDDDGRHYYEVDARPGRLRLERFAKPDGQPRQNEPIDVTRETLYRLTDDLSEAVGE